MFDKQSGNTSKHGKQEQDGPIRYLDPGALAKPIDIPRNKKIIMSVFAIVAALLGALALSNLVGNVSGTPSNTAKQVQKAIATTKDVKLPKLADYTINDADGIKSRLSEAGVSYYDNSKNSDYDLDLVSIPDGLKAADVKAILTDGVNSVDAVTAARYLSGTWRMQGYFRGNIDLRIRVCDMNATTPEAALKDAAKSQGYKLKKKAKRTTDTAGNTSVSGKVSTESGTCKWTISACDLSNVYNVTGVPKVAQYVGIHLTA